MRQSGKSLIVGASLIAGLLLVSTFTPAQAAAKSGAVCSKEGAKTKIGKDRYVCAQNPIVKKKQLTWVWGECLTANRLYTDSVTRLSNLKTNAAIAQTKLNELIAALPAAELQAKEFDAKYAAALVKRDDALKQAAENQAKATQVGPTTPAGLTYTKNASLWTSNARTYELAMKNFERAAKSNRSKAEDVAKEKRRLDLQFQTIAASEVEIKSNNTSRRQACKPGL